MPARRSSSNGHSTRPDGDRRSETPPDATAANSDDITEAEVTTGDPAAETGPADEVTDDDVPMNRAARRAKGRAATQPRPAGKILPGRTNQSHGPRSYANRRSG